MVMIVSSTIIDGPFSVKSLSINLSNSESSTVWRRSFLLLESSSGRLLIRSIDLGLFRDIPLDDMKIFSPIRSEYGKSTSFVFESIDSSLLFERNTTFLVST